MHAALSRRPRFPALALLLALASCAGAPEAPEAEPYTPPPVPEPDPIGYFVAQLDNQLRAWSNLKLSARSSDDLRKLRGLEREIEQATTRRKDELQAELESPSPKNRSVAAIALGFTGDEAIVGPLLAALSDPEPLVVHNALIGLGVLASPTTPLARIAYLMENAEDPGTRSNAAYAIGATVGAGGGDDAVAPACRAALIDAEPGVRMQAATILGRLGDAHAIAPLGDLLYDETPLVVRAAAAALASIGAQNVEETGPIARKMVEAAARRKADVRRAILFELRRIASFDYGDDLERWSEWAYRLP